MPSSDDDIIRNGTLKQWWNYEVVFGGTVQNATAHYPYAIKGGIRIKGKWLVVTAVVLVVTAVVLALAAAGFVL